MLFEIDSRLIDSCIHLGQWPLSSVLLKNNAHFAWCILVPRKPQLTAIHDLPQNLQHLLIDEIHQLSTIMLNYFKPQKINTGILGNMVSQLHIHVVGRYRTDPLWPHGIWQENQPTLLYSEEIITKLEDELKLLITKAF